MSKTNAGSEIVRTPEARFAVVKDYPWNPSYIEIEPGLRMAYVDAGPPDAHETILLLHGQPMWGYLYRKMIGPLVDAGHRVIVPDLIGFGRSDKFVDQKHYSYSAHVGWITALIKALDLKQMTIFGQDWGGLIGTRVLAENESRFARAVMSNTALVDKGAPAFPGLTAQQPLSSEDLKNKFGMDWRATVDEDDCINPEKIRKMIEAGPTPYFLQWRVYSQAVAELKPSKIMPGWCAKPVSDSARAAYDAPFPDERHSAAARRFPMLVPITADDPERVVNAAAWAVLEKWNKPFLTIWGTQCPFTYTQMGNEFRTRIPGAKLPGLEHKVVHAGHYIQEDLGEEVALGMVDLIAKFQ